MSLNHAPGDPVHLIHPAEGVPRDFIVADTDWYDNTIAYRASDGRLIWMPQEWVEMVRLNNTEEQK